MKFQCCAATVFELNLLLANKTRQSDLQTPLADLARASRRASGPGLFLIFPDLDAPQSEEFMLKAEWFFKSPPREKKIDQEVRSQSVNTAPATTDQNWWRLAAGPTISNLAESKSVPIPRSRHRHFDALSIFRIARETEDPNRTLKTMGDNFTAFAREATKPTTTDYLGIQTTTGIPDTYLQEPAVYGQNFESWFGFANQRAAVESHKWLELAQWISQVEAGQTSDQEMFVWISPHGSEAEGYMGTKPTDPHLITIYRAKNRQVEAWQIRSWAPGADLGDHPQNHLLNFAQQIGLRERDSSAPPSDNQTSRNRLIAMSGLVPTQNLTKIERIAYQYEDKATAWHVKRAWMPRVNLDAYQNYLNTVSATYAKLLSKMVLEIGFEKLLDEKFLGTKAAHHLVDQMDSLLEVLIQSLEGWVSSHDQRQPEEVSDQQIRSELIATIKTRTSQQTPDEPTLTEAVSAMVSAKSFGKVALNIPSELASSLFLNLPSRTLSLGQCIAFSPASIMAKMAGGNKMMISGLPMGEALARSEGWLNRKGVCANSSCGSPQAGAEQHLGPCGFCWWCDQRSGRGRYISATKGDRSASAKTSANHHSHTKNHARLPTNHTIGLTHFVSNLV